MNVEQLIKNGLKKGSDAVDYSPAFTAYAKTIANTLSNSLDVKTYHSDDMNYSHAQIIFLFLDLKFNLISFETDAQYQVKIWVSSIENLYIITFFEKLQSQPITWKRVLFPQNIILDNLINRIDEVMLTFSLSKFPSEKENLSAEGYYTELDNLPATLFQFFFSELE
ncbi:MAG: hypothetical protein ABIN67_09480 [Ferruginibacter sp.]